MLLVIDDVSVLIIKEEIYWNEKEDVKCCIGVHIHGKYTDQKRSILYCNINEGSWKQYIEGG